jgi:hypothetical protein
MPWIGQDNTITNHSFITVGGFQYSEYIFEKY